MFINLFDTDNDMRCLFCSHPVQLTTHCNGYTCTRCNVYYFLNGNACLETLSEFAIHYRNNTSEDGRGGVVPVVQDQNHGCYWFWCSTHDEYERDAPFSEEPCPVRIFKMTPLLSG